MKTIFFTSIIVLLFQTCFCLAGNENIILGQIAVNSGEYKRMDSPVSIALENITNETGLRLYELINGEFVPVEFQFSTDGERRIHWLLSGSATRNTSWKLEPGINYSLRYRLLVFDRVIDEVKATTVWNDYANPPVVTWKQNDTSPAKYGKWDNRTGNVEGINLLVFTKVGEGGFVHKSICPSINAFEKLAEQNGINLDISDDPAVFTDENLKKYHALVFLNTNNDVFDTPEQKLSLMRYVQAGGGFAGVHIAVGTERDWPWYKKMIGATFDRHPPYQEFSVKVIDGDHPSAVHLPETWIIRDEPYYVKEYNPEVRVILSHDLSTIEDSREKPEIFGNLYPAVWCNTFDGGRQWYTGYGHDDHIYSDPVFMQHILGGIKWVIADGLPDYSKARSTSIDDL